MRVIICDDIEQDALKLEQELSKPSINIKIDRFHSGYDVIGFIRSGVLVDICFLDIIMPDMNGIELAQELRAAGFAGEIVFLTTSNEYAAESYQIKAFGYLLKPVNSADVHNILQEYKAMRIKGDSEGIFVKVSKVARHIPFHDISHIEVINHYVLIRLTDSEEIEIRSTFAEIAGQLLRDPRFTQCHRSYVVNMSDIASIDDREIVMRSYRKIPYSRSYYNIKKKFTKWILGGGKQT